MISKNELIKKWENCKGAMSIKNIEDPYVKENLAQLLENQESKDLQGREVFSEASDGTINTTNLDASTNADWRFRPVALALMRRTFPDLFANKVVGVQAMSTPVGLSYALRFTYEKDGTGVEAAWDDVDLYGGFTGNPGTSAALQQNFGTGALSATNAGIYDSSGTGLSTSAGEALQIKEGCLSDACSAEPEWNQLGLRIDQVAIDAKTRKLAASFSLEAAQDIRAMHGVDIEREMVNVLQYEITAELDRELLTRMKLAATDTSKGGQIVTAINCGTGGDIDGRWSGEKYMNIVASIIHQANVIATSTRRGPGNFVVVSPSIASALQAAGHQFVQYDSKVNPTTTMAAIGRLNGTLEVYRDQYAKADYALVGYKGPGVSDAGIIFSPYIMGLQNRAISPDDFSPRIGVMSRYAITDSLLNSGRYYRLIPFYNVGSIIAGAGL
jgi:hypothetical protein